MWFDVTSEDSNRALNFARETVDGTYNRMGYQNTPSNLRRRQFHIYVGKVAEHVVFRYIEEVKGIQILQESQTRGPDKFDFKINHHTKDILGDVKSTHVYRRWNSEIRRQSQIEQNAMALVPMDQYFGQPKDVYIFVVILGDQAENILDLTSEGSGVCFMRWATYSEIGNWKFIPQGTPVFPYDRTRTDNYGQKMSECKTMDNFHIQTL